MVFFARTSEIHVWWFYLGTPSSEILDCCWILFFLNYLFCYCFNSCLTCVVCLRVEARVPTTDNQATHKKNENHTRNLCGLIKRLRPWPKRIHSLLFHYLRSRITDYIIFIIFVFLAPKKTADTKTKIPLTQSSVPS